MVPDSVLEIKQNTKSYGFNDSSSLKEEIEVSVLVAIYKPNKSKLLTTLKSIIAQKNIKKQIVISDDGTDDFDSSYIEEFMEKNSFSDYYINSCGQNKGTVYNVLEGLKYCKAKYTKVLSPGDYLYGLDVLRRWVDYINISEADVSFGKSIHYEYDNDKMIPIRVNPHPQKMQNFYRNMWEYNYLIFDDICTGAAVLTNTKKMIEYIDLIKDKVIYAEDNIYRLMAYKGERACYFNENVILYEHGLGVSTSNNNYWSERLSADWEATNNLILKNKCPNKLVELNFKRKIHFSKYNTIFRKASYIMINGFIYKLSLLIKNKTDDKVDEEYVELISDI